MPRTLSTKRRMAFVIDSMNSSRIWANLVVVAGVGTAESTEEQESSWGGEALLWLGEGEPVLVGSAGSEWESRIGCPLVLTL